MDGETRAAGIVALLQERGRVEICDAAAHFGTSEMTIRRDLDRLVERGVARRVRGGAVSLLMRGEELPFSMREAERAGAKRAIAARVGELIADGEAIVLDSGTTAVEVARVLSPRRLTVMPLSLHAAMALSDGPAIRLLIPGGETRFGELAMVGPLTEASIAALRFDTAIVTCCGLSTEGVITAHDLGEAATKRAMMASANRVLLVADSSKFARSAMAVVCDSSHIDVVITDAFAPADAVLKLEDRGVEVHCV
jgi:DeoR/GlpR family transcriptional regulator of sugar metabolism